MDSTIGSVICFVFYVLRQQLFDITLAFVDKKTWVSYRCHQSSYLFEKYRLVTVVISLVIFLENIG